MFVVAAWCVVVGVCGVLGYTVVSRPVVCVGSNAVRPVFAACGVMLCCVAPPPTCVPVW